MSHSVRVARGVAGVFRRNGPLREFAQRGTRCSVFSGIRIFFPPASDPAAASRTWRGRYARRLSFATILDGSGPFRGTGGFREGDDDLLARTEPFRKAGVFVSQVPNRRSFHFCEIEAQGSLAAFSAMLCSKALAIRSISVGRIPSSIAVDRQVEVAIATSLMISRAFRRESAKY